MKLVVSKEYLEGYHAGLWEEDAKCPYEKDTQEYKDWWAGNISGFGDWDLGMDDGG